jgi:hypothetical protein
MSRDSENRPVVLGRNPGGTPELEKWSGRLDSNQRPPAPKSAVSLFPAMLCETTIRLKLLMSNDLTHVIAGHCVRQIASWNPAGTPQRSHFLARYRTMTPCFRHDSAQWVSVGLRHDEPGCASSWPEDQALEDFA